MRKKIKKISGLLTDVMRASICILRGGTVIYNAELHNPRINIKKPHTFFAKCVLTHSRDFRYCTREDMKYLYGVGTKQVKTFVMAKMLGKKE